MAVPCIKKSAEKKHLFLTGEKRVGKSTLIQSLLVDLTKQNKKAGGFYTRRTDVCSPGFYAVHLLLVFPDGSSEEASEKNRLFFCDPAMQEKEENRLRRFEMLGIEALKKAEKEKVSLILMDELGPGEEEADAFQTAVFQTLDGDIPVLGVLQRAPSAFLAAIASRPDVEVAEVTVGNRDTLAGEWHRLLTEK